MSDHAVVKDEHRKFVELLDESIVICESFEEATQFLADFARDGRLKEAETWMEELTRPVHGRHTWDWAKERIEQLKRGKCTV